ncbi:GNAT family N-acetyltransferase [Marinicrinis lubricantis]|uniref:GNAT family N-acetyltransferase n=1 Tax=Marinicrinis lubricantis TaxID=2086470 RepID=A0ABW1IPG7_9BACL
MLDIEIIAVTTQEQLQQCLNIRKAVFVEEQNVPLELEVDEYDESPNACSHILIRSAGENAATGRHKPYDSETAKMQRIAVLKLYRGTGLGRILLEALEQSAREQGFRAAKLDAQLQARAFYEKCGYEVVSEDVFLDAGIPHVTMKKYLQH